MKIQNFKEKINFSTLRWIFKNTKGSRGLLIFLIVINALEAGMSVYYALACKNIVDGAVSGEWKNLERAALILFAVILAQQAATAAENFADEYMCTTMRLGFQKNVIQTLLDRKYSELADYHSGELQTRIFSDVDVVVNAISSIVPYMTYQIVRLAGAVLVLISLAPQFTLIFVIAGVLMLIGMLVFREKFKSLHKEMQRTEGEVRSFLQDVLTSMLVVKVFGAGQQVVQKIDENQKHYFRARMKRRTISIITNSFLDLVFELGYFLAMLWGCLGIFHGTFTYGSLTAMLQLVNQIQGPFSSFSGYVSQYFSASASAERLMELEDLQGEESRAESGTVSSRYSRLTSMEYSHVSFGYGKKNVLNDFCYSIQKGDFIAITGESGGGKSTLFLLLMGAYEPAGGTITGHFEDGTRKESLSGLFAYVPQGNYLFSGTLRENVTFFRSDYTDEQVKEALRLACADSFVDELPDGLDTQLGEKGHGLSEGQMQRIAVARALISGAPILLLDEVTSALDEETEAQLLANIRGLHNRTCLIVTHRPAALAICNRECRI